MVKQALILLLIVIAFGVALPWVKGLDFLDPVFVVAYACTGIFFSAPAAAEAFGSASMTRSANALRMAAILAYGWGVSALLLFSGIFTVNIANWHGHFLTPSVHLLGSALFLSAAACLAVTALAAVLASSYGSRTAKTVLRLGFLALLLLLAVGFRHLPQDWQLALNRNLTSAGLTRAAVHAGIALTLLGTAMATWWLTRRVSPIADILDMDTVQK